jgi:hypothetical protein
MDWFTTAGLEKLSQNVKIGRLDAFDLLELGLQWIALRQLAGR